MKRIFPLILIAFLSLLLSSCTEDSWTTGTLDYTFRPQTSSSGYFEAGSIYYPADISTNDYANAINDFYMVSSFVQITGELKRGDVIHGLRIDIDGVGKYDFNDIPIYEDNEYFVLVDSSKNRDFYNFMYNAFNQMKFSGKHDIIVSGFLYDKNGYTVPGSKVQIEFYNDLNVNVTN
jgi:hypothetical protein